MDRCCEYRSFRFDERYTDDKLEAFCRDFFNDREVLATLRTATRQGEMVRGGLGGGGAAAKFPRGMGCCRLVPTNLVRMDFFKRLREEGLVVGEQGRMRQCMPEFYDGVESGTLVREMMLNEDSEHYLVYDDDEKDEFLFRLFRHLVIGGGMCQAEENVDPYLDAVRELYKSLLTVKKTEGGAVRVTSSVIAVEASSRDLPGLFPKASDHNLCYLIVDKAKRKVTFWSNAYVSFW